MCSLKKIALLITGFCIISTASAAVHLELTQGVNSALPIAIVPFTNQINNVPGNTTLSQVISSDLQNSGEFRVLTPNFLSQQPTQVSAIDTNFWRKQNVNDVVIGQVRPIGANKFEVSFQLVNVLTPSNTATANSAQNNAVLLNQTFTTNQPGLRALAHHISDLIYQKLTGVRGIFSTKISYVLVQNRNSSTPKYQLIVADEDGFNPQALLTSSQPIMSPSWSPSGHVLAYVSFEGHHAAIYAQDLSSGNRILVARYPGMNNAPAFSPRGQRMAMTLTLDGNPNLYVMDLANKHLTQITNDFSIDTEPTFSPDGNSLYFTSNRSGNAPQIFRYDFASRQVSRVTFEGDYNARACVSPHATTLVVLHRDSSGFNIAKQNLTTGRVSILTNSGMDDSPSLAPNGKMVLYGTRLGGRDVLGLVSIDGRVKLRLPSQAGDVQDPSWSPFLS